MTVYQCLEMDFSNGTGIKHTNPNHGSLSDKSAPSSYFAGYGPVSSKYSCFARTENTVRAYLASYPYKQ